MATLKVRRVPTEEVASFIFAGGIIGKVDSVYPTAFAGLVGTTLTFTSPVAASVTFVSGVDTAKQVLTFAELRSQIETAVPTVAVRLFGPTLIGLIEKTPTSGVALAAAGSDAKARLGFSRDVATVGKVYKTPVTNTPPCLVSMYADPASGSHVIVTWE